MRKSRMPGSSAPDRVHMAIPSMGVKPIVVSTLFPPTVAASEHPPPKWQIINRNAGSFSRLSSRAAWPEAQRKLVP